MKKTTISLKLLKAGWAFTIWLSHR